MSDAPFSLTVVCEVKYKMLKISEIKIPVTDSADLNGIAAKKLGIGKDAIISVKILRKSIDARKTVCYVYTLLVEVKNESAVLKRGLKNVSQYRQKKYTFPYNGIKTATRPVITGAGPAGLFCALMLSRAGIRPILIERGESVEEREKSIDAFWNGGELNENSNVQFGEGGAGTFSDGKLTCGLNDERMSFILEEFIKSGAPEEIGYLAKPHIGTDFLKNVVASIRSEIISNGGEVRFCTRLADIDISDGCVSSVTLEDLKTSEKYNLDCSVLVLATGHSSRDTYRMLYEKGIIMEKKPFSVGVRIEHKREYINKIQYKNDAFSDSLPAADYKLSCHPDGRGVYTFCMCPGGRVVASASERGGVVTNGMSCFARDEENSNSALLVSVRPEDIDGGVLEAVEFQRKMESDAFKLGGGNYFAPCQTVGDFLNDRPSEKCGGVNPSYLPGVKYTDVSECLPEFVCIGLKNALRELDKKMPGFCLVDALLTGVETRSSAPLRIVRDESMTALGGLYPIGEGAGYAGGIMSSAIDGIKCAEKIAQKLAK